METVDPYVNQSNIKTEMSIPTVPELCFMRVASNPSIAELPEPVSPMHGKESLLITCRACCVTVHQRKLLVDLIKTTDQDNLHHLWNSPRFLLLERFSVYSKLFFSRAVKI